MSTYIELLPDDQTFVWQPTDPDTGRKPDSQFTLRRLTGQELVKITDSHTARKWVRGRLRESSNDRAIAEDVIDAAIVDWADLYVRGENGSGRQAVPCERRYKLLLPEWIKAEIIQMCGGGDAPNLGAEDGQDARPPSEPTSRGSKTKGT